MQFWSLNGLISYDDARAFMRGLVDLRARDEIGDTVLFLEHAPVITRGRGLQAKPGEARGARHIPMPPSPLPPGIQFSESERGGDLTYHGPGQLVIYPIVKLTDHDIGAFLRRMERWLIDELAALGLTAEARENATGVWVGDRKVASIGIAVRKWVTWHGLAINVVNDLAPFHLISPCGFSPEVMTRLSNLIPVETLWRGWLQARLAERLHPGARVRNVELSSMFQPTRSANEPASGSKVSH